MPIILFTGLGVTEKLMKAIWNGKKHIKTDFVDKLKGMKDVIIPDIKYKHVYYYLETPYYNTEKFFDPIEELTLDDLNIEKTVQNLNINKKKKYIVMGHSDGIYYALEFAKQYPKLTQEIISLDGSWATVKLCKQRLTNWKNKGKKAKLITSQRELDNIMKKVKNNDNDAIGKIITHIRYEHTKKCISKKYQNIIKKTKFTIFRDFNSNPDDQIDRQFNEYATTENNIMTDLSKNYQIFWQINASHTLWEKDIYKNQILNYIKSVSKGV